MPKVVHGLMPMPPSMEVKMRLVQWEQNDAPHTGASKYDGTKSDATKPDDPSGSDKGQKVVEEAGPSDTYANVADKVQEVMEKTIEKIPKLTIKRSEDFHKSVQLQDSTTADYTLLLKFMGVNMQLALWTVLSDYMTSEHLTSKHFKAIERYVREF